MENDEIGIFFDIRYSLFCGSIFVVYYSVKLGIRRLFDVERRGSSLYKHNFEIPIR